MINMIPNNLWLKHRTMNTIKNIIYDIPLIIKTILWHKIIDTKYGWHDYIQGEIDDIDIDQLMTDRAEDNYNGMCETYD